jgi:hypothetical protein
MNYQEDLIFKIVVLAYNYVIFFIILSIALRLFKKLLKLEKYDKYY